MTGLFTEQSVYFYVSNSDAIITPNGFCQWGISISE